MNHKIIINHPEQISSQWAQHIVSHYYGPAQVSDVSIRSMNIGTSTRLRLLVEHDVPERIPRRWFVKTPSLRWQSKSITTVLRQLHKEVSFYQTFADAVPVKLPQILAAQSHFGRGSTLVMTDLDEFGFMPGQPGDSLSFEQARQVVTHLAQFHSQFWGEMNLLKHYRWLGGFNNNLEKHLGTVLAVPLIRRGLQNAGDVIPGRLHAPALRYAANRSRIMKWFTQCVPTLIHHDCHPGNLFWTDSGPGFLDWQLVRVGEGISDIAYFLATSLTPECRRTYERQLLALYLNLLQKAGIEHLDADSLYQRYCAHLVYPFEAMVITLAIGGMIEFNSNLELIRRTLAAIDDHDSFALLAQAYT